MNNLWNHIRLGDICNKIGSGATPRGGKDVYSTTGEISLIRSQNVYNEGFNENGLVYINQKIADRLNNVIIQPNDILLNITGDSVARCCIVPKKFLPARVNQHVSIIRCNDSFADNRFIRYLLISDKIQNLLFSLASSGATRNAITKSMIEDLILHIPSDVKEQRAIAHILGTLDEKIELNRQMNETLEEMARAIFKSWFIDFDPVHAKAEGRQPFGMDEETAALFPEEFEDSELGMIPKGWKSIELKDIAKIINGRSYKSSELIESDVALVTLKSVNREGGYNSNGLKAYSGKFNDDQIIKPGEVVIACTDVTQKAEVIGKPAMVYSDPKYKQLVASQDILIVRPIHDKSDSQYLYLLLGSNDFQEFAFAHTNGSTVLHLDKKAIPNYCLISPPLDIKSAFLKFISPIYDKKHLMSLESSILISARDTILPKLVSGEIRVNPDAFNSVNGSDYKLEI